MNLFTPFPRSANSSLPLTGIRVVRSASPEERPLIAFPTFLRGLMIKNVMITIIAAIRTTEHVIAVAIRGKKIAFATLSTAEISIPRNKTVINSPDTLSLNR